MEKLYFVLRLCVRLHWINRSMANIDLYLSENVFSFVISGGEINRLTAQFNYNNFHSLFLGHIYGDVAMRSGVRQQNDSLLMIYYHDQVVAIGK